MKTNIEKTTIKLWIYTFLLVDNVEKVKISSDSGYHKLGPIKRHYRPCIIYPSFYPMMNNIPVKL